MPGNPPSPDGAESLGRRYLAAGGEWRARMHGLDPSGKGFTVLHAHAGQAIVADDRAVMGELWLRAEALGRCQPDPRDAATVGAMLGFVREKAGEPTLHARPLAEDSRLGDGETVILWCVERQHADGGGAEWLRESGAWGAAEAGHRDPPVYGRSEAEAIVGAGEAIASSRGAR